MLNCLKFHHTRYDRVYAPTSNPVLAKMLSWDHGLLRAANSHQL